MATKTGRSTRQRPRVEEDDSQKELHAIYEIHTLAQMIFRHVAVTRPWTAAAPGWTPYETTASFLR